MEIYPNPSDSYIILEFEKVQTGSLSVFSITGILMTEFSFTNMKADRINLEKYTKGVYFLKIIFKEGNMETWNFELK